nr:Na-translocating system protein MpsB [Nevskia sp.]
MSEILNRPAVPTSAATLAADTLLHAQIDAACAQACKAIAPAWPLDRAIAVNPHWSRTGLPLRRVAARMAVLADIRVFPPRAQVLQAWQQG